MAFTNPKDDVIRDLLEQANVIAVIGLSPKQNRPSHGVARALQGFGYRIIPVRPIVKEVLGEQAYARLEDVPDKIDLVDVFRNPQYVDAIVDSCINLGIPAIWLQEGVINDSAALRAQNAGLTVVMDRCTYKDYIRLCR
jgi:predicted CoA-binding protein